MATDTNIDTEELAPLTGNSANSNWDATGIRHQFLDTIFCLSPADFPSAPEGCNLLFMNPVLSSMPDFYNTNIAQVKQIIQPDGFFGAQGQLLYLEFPSTFGTTFADSVQTVFSTLAVDLGIPANPLFDSAQVIFRQISNSSFLAYGDLRVNYTNFPVNTIKRKLIQRRKTIFKVRNKITGAYVDIPNGFDPGGINSVKTIYQWFGVGGGVPLLEFEMDTMYKARNLKYLVNSSRFMSTGFGEQNLIQHSIKIYPNPGNEYFEISIPGKAKIDVLSIYNTSGVLLKEFENILPDSKIFHEIESSGLFIIQIKQNNQVFYTRWMKL
jgi:hypothetical protein